MKLSLIILLCACVCASAAPAPAAKQTRYCIYSWWPTKTCGVFGEDCFGTETPNGFETEEDCLAFGGSVTTTTTPTDTMDYNNTVGYCVTSWWPRACGNVEMASTNCRLGSALYEDSTSCMGGVASETENGWCTTSWWPKTCGLLADGNCTGSEYPPGGFVDEDTCMYGQTYTDYSEDLGDTGFCVTSWWPRDCGDLSDSETSCVRGSTAFDSEEDCRMGFDAPVTDGFCITSWWPTKMCEPVSSGNCFGWYPPPGGWATNATCMSVGA